MRFEGTGIIVAHGTHNMYNNVKLLHNRRKNNRNYLHLSHAHVYHNIVGASRACAFELFKLQPIDTIYRVSRVTKYTMLPYIYALYVYTYIYYICTYQMLHGTAGRLSGDVLARTGRQPAVHQVEPQHGHRGPDGRLALRSFEFHYDHDLLPGIRVRGNAFRFER